MNLRSLLQRLLPGRRGTDASDATHPSGLSRAHFERIVEIAADAIISVDQDQRIILYNQGARETFGYEQHEVMGQHLDMLLPKRFRQTHGTHMEHFASGPEAARLMGARREIAGLSKNGREFPAEATISRFGTPDGDIFTVVLRDTSERHKAEHTQRFLANASDVLARSLDYEATMVGLARLAVPHLGDWCVVDASNDDGVTRVAAAHADPDLQPVAQRLTDYPPTPDRPHPSFTVLETGEPELLAQVPDSLLATLAVDDAHRTLLQRLGVASLLVVPIVARERTLGAFTLVSADASRPFGPDDVELARELGRRAGLAVDNARLYHQAKEALAARDEVLGVVSHDLGNPLSAIRVATRVIQGYLDRGEVAAAREQVASIRAAAGQMGRLIRDLLEIRRIESGRLKLVRRPEPVADLVGEAVRSMEGIAAEQDVRLESVLDPGLPDTIRVDADRIRQVFSNLVGNALRFTPSGGTITVGAEPVDADTAVRFWVEDTGSGIPADEIDHIFDRFWQARQHGSPGVGLGLAIARGMTEAHGGTVAAQSREGQGSTFSFIIPR